MDACHAQGIRAIARTVFRIRREVYEQHPDWAARLAWRHRRYNGYVSVLPQQRVSKPLSLRHSQRTVHQPSF
ncbi:MAG: hypothetical protein ACLRI7_14380 [Ruthenibacterium lactatiformans]